MRPATVVRATTAMLRIRGLWPMLLIAGVSASVWASQIGWSSILILLAGLMATGALVWIVARAERSRLDPVVPSNGRTRTPAADRIAPTPDGVLTIATDPLRITIDRNLAEMWRLPLASTNPQRPEAMLDAILAPVAEPDRLRADISRLQCDSNASLQREVELGDGRTFELHAASVQGTAGMPGGWMSVFIFHDVSDRKRAAAELQFANSLLRTQMEASPLGVLVVDDFGNITSRNQRLVELFHVEPALYDGHVDGPVLAAFAAQVKDKDAFLARVRYLYEHPEENDLDEIVMNDGRILERHSAQLKTPLGQSLGRVWFFDDITEIRKSAREAKEERDLVTAFLDGLPGYFVLIDGAGRLIRWNESIRLLNGLTDDQVAGSDPFANIVESDRAATLGKVRETIAKGSAELEFSIRSASLGIRTIRWNGRRITVAGQPQVLAIGIDLTEIRAAEALLRASEERFRAIFESVSDGILVQDAATGAVIDANPRQCEMFGYTRDEFLHLDAARSSIEMTPESATKFAAARQNVPGAAFVVERLCRAKDEREFWCEISSREVKNFGGRDVVLSTVRDITERREAAAAVSYRDRILQALTLSTAQLVKTASYASSMPALLRSVGEELHVDRILIIQLDGTHDGPNLAFSWQREGVPPLDLAPYAAPVPDAKQVPEIAAWLAPLVQGWPVATQVDSAKGAVRQILLDANVQSNLLLPISVDGVYWGQIGVDETSTARQWSSVEIDALRTLADVIGALIARERMERSLQQSEEQFRAVSDTVLDAIIMIGIDGRIRYWNHAAERMFGYSAAEANGKMIHEWLGAERFRDQAHQGMAGFVTTGEGPIIGKTVEMAATRKDGVEIAIELSVNTMMVGPQRYAVGVARDITERKRASALIERMARYDILTGLPNRRLFIESLEQAIGRASRSGQLFAVFYFDLDHFKAVNDTHGHPAGDRFLQAVGERLRASVRDVDTVARFGGDEFAAIQIDIREPADAAFLANKLVQALGEPFFLDDFEIHSGVSVGIAVYGPESPDAETLLAHADVALYRAKAEGRGIYRFYTDAMDVEGRARVDLDGELRSAIAANQFFLLYDPRIDTTTGRIIGLEALLRWQHPQRGVIQPENFIPAAEKSGFIVDLGNWMVGEICRQSKRWLDSGIAPPFVAFNVSASQFNAPVALEISMANAIRECNVSGQRLELELSEGALMEASQEHIEALLGLRTLGVRIAISGFGRDYFSLEFLSRFHVDRINIPPRFVADLSPVSENAPIVRATLGLARELGIAVIAQGVENAAVFALLKQWGCREMQGTYFSEPLPASGLDASLRIGTMLPT